jgi:peroxin-2
VSSLKSNDEDNEQPEKQGELAFLHERTCAICYKESNPESSTESEVLAASAASGGITGSAQTDITNPYEAIPCGCVYCFVCLVQKLEGEEGEGWICLRCGEIIKKCKPWHGDVLEEARPQSSSGKIVGFAVDEDAGVHGNESEKEMDGSVEKSSPLQDSMSDGALQHSSQWSTVEGESD